MRIYLAVALSLAFLGGSILPACGGESGHQDSSRGGQPATGDTPATAPKPATPSESSAAPPKVPAAPPQSPDESTAAMPQDPAGTATIRGTVRFQGTQPRRREIPMSGNPDCAALHSEPVLAETVIVNDNGTLRNVFVYIKSGLPRTRYPAPSEPVVLDQRGCIYTPHVLGIQVGQPLRIRNSDPLMHNIHTRSQRNGEWNFSQANQGQEDERTFRIPEVMVQFTCDVHSWMNAYVGVLAHPFFAVTGQEGTFTLSNVPAGTYTLEAWHERYGTLEREVTLAAGATAEVEFTFSGDGGGR